jgi:putative membrane protein
VTDRGPASAPMSDWERLDLRVVAVKVLRVLGPILPIVVGLTVFGQRSGPDTIITFVAIGLGAVAVTIGDLVRWARTDFRLTGERVELRSGLLTRTHLTVPRERIRRVELTSPLAHRILGLSVVTVGTAEQGAEGDTITLDAVTGPRATALRRQLLGLVPGPTPADGSITGGPEPGTPAPEEADGGELIARLRWRWAPYDVLSYWTLLLPAIALGGIYQLASAAGLEIDPEVVVDGAGRLRSERWAAVGAVAALVVLGAVLVGALGSLALFVTTWWGYELRRERGDTLKMTRGLFTTRTATFDEHRLRGVEVHESLLQRAAGGARVLAIAHGLGGGEQATSDRKDALAPPCPRVEADLIAAGVLRCPTSPTAAPLVPHPLAARARRLVRAAAATGVAIVVGAAAIGPGPAPPLTGVLVVLVGVGAVMFALASYRSLGHAIAGPFLVARRGVLIRRTTALERSGIIGWTIHQSWFQRRRGLADLVATTAAGTGAYVVADLTLDDAARLAAAAAVGPGSFPSSLAFAA